MHISQGNCWARVVCTSDAEDEWLKSYLTIALADGTRDVLYSDGKFPAGLVRRVVRAAAAEGYGAQVRDDRAPAARGPLPALSWLRDYQLEAVRAGLEARNGIVWAPPGAGKGEIAVAWSMAIERPLAEGHVLFLVHRRQLAEDIATRWTARTGRPAGLAVSRGWRVEGCGFIAATFSALHAAFRRGDLAAEDLVDRAYGLVVDECHVAPASTHRSISLRCDNAGWRLGLSATPLDRSDRRTAWAIGALGPLCYRIKPQLLIDLQHVAACRCTFVRYQHGCMSDEPPWPVRYHQAVVKSRGRNELVVKITKSCPKPALVFVSRDEHGEILQAALAAEGLRTARVWGASRPRERDDCKSRLASGELDVVVCSVVWQEGLDIARLASVVVAGAGRSVIASVQRSGRGSRLAEGKQQYRLFDIMDMAPKMYLRRNKETEAETLEYNGLYMLARWADQRLKTYKREAHEIEIVEAGAA